MESAPPIFPIPPSPHLILVLFLGASCPAHPSTGPSMEMERDLKMIMNKPKFQPHNINN
jgi:hypothetical protein